MQSKKAFVRRAVLGGVSTLIVPALHKANSRNIGKTNQVVQSVASWPVPLRPITGPEFPRHVVGHARGAAARIGLGQTSCIARSQFAYVLLTWAGYSTVVKTGAQPDVGRGGEAHAWVEVDGTAVGENPDELGTYGVLVQQALPPAPV